VTSILKVQDLRKVYAHGHDEIVAVAGVSFELDPGSCLAIVGESGSGKTTIARMVAGLEKATSGSIELGGVARPPLPWPRSSRRRLSSQVQMVFQDPNSSLDPSQTVEQSLVEVLRVHAGLSREASLARVPGLLQRVHLRERVGQSLPGRLSGGEKQRVAIARALAVEPSLLILDESVSALDVSVQAQVVNLLCDLRTDLGLTYLFITHDLGVVRQVSDECLVMRRGLVVEAGSTDDVLSQPKTAYTRELLAAVPRAGWAPSRRHTATGAA
jgi:ABC-type glutathione transport system ATPase component